MHVTFDLASVIDALARIRDAGWWPDLEAAFFVVTRGPLCDLDRWPLHGPPVENLAQIASHLLWLPLGLCPVFAVERLLPQTRTRIVLEIIREPTPGWPNKPNLLHCAPSWCESVGGGGPRE